MALGLASPGVGEPLTVYGVPLACRKSPCGALNLPLDLQLICVLTRSTFLLGEVWVAEPRKFCAERQLGASAGAADAKQQTLELGWGFY